MLENNIAKITEELNRYKNQSRAELFRNCISKKLKTTLENYEVDLQKTTDFLYQAESARVMKALVKIQKKDDKNTILETLVETTEEEGNPLNE